MQANRECGCAAVTMAGLPYLACKWHQLCYLFFKSSHSEALSGHAVAGVVKYEEAAGVAPLLVNPNNIQGLTVCKLVRESDRVGVILQGLIVSYFRSSSGRFEKLMTQDETIWDQEGLTAAILQHHVHFDPGKYKSAPKETCSSSAALACAIKIGDQAAALAGAENTCRTHTVQHLTAAQFGLQRPSAGWCHPPFGPGPSSSTQSVKPPVVEPKMQQTLGTLQNGHDGSPDDAHSCLLPMSR